MWRVDGGMNPLNSSSPSVSIPQWFIFIPQIICNRCHAQRAYRRNNVIFLMDFQDECESDGTDTTEALLVLFIYLFIFCINVLWLFKQVNFMQMWPLLAMAEFTNSRRRKGQTNTVDHFSADYYSCKCLCGMSCTALACDTITPQSGCTTVFLFQRALFYTSQSFLFSLSK